MHRNDIWYMHHTYFQKSCIIIFSTRDIGSTCINRTDSPRNMIGSSPWATHPHTWRGRNDLANPHGNLRNWSLLMMSSCWQLNLDEYLAAYPPFANVSRMPVCLLLDPCQEILDDMSCNSFKFNFSQKSDIVHASLALIIVNMPVMATMEFPQLFFLREIL